MPSPIVPSSSLSQNPNAPVRMNAEKCAALREKVAKLPTVEENRQMLLELQKAMTEIERLGNLLLGDLPTR